MGNQASATGERDPRLTVEDGEHYVGFENRGNICYCSSVLQSLYYCKPLRDKMLTYGIPDAEEQDELMLSLIDLFRHISTFKKKVGVTNLKRVMSVIQRTNILFEGDYHQDSHELLIWLLNELKDTVTRDMKRGNSESASKTSKRNSRFGEGLNSRLSSYRRSGTEEERHERPKVNWVEEIFGGVLSSVTRCLCCETISQRDEPFMDLSVDVESNCSITHCLRNFSSTEVLTGNDKFFCGECGCLQEAEKRIVIKKLPQVLIVQLKRFKYNETMGRHQKLTSRVVFPFELKLTIVSSDCENPDTIYDLYAAVIHIGPGFQYGHCIAVVKSNGMWLKFDDDLIEVVDEKYLYYIFGTSREGKETNTWPCAYLLFYQAREDEYSKKKTQMDYLLQGSLKARR
mmetsp:Transcript_39543/g.45021  ORF Transcript_39543/g.45021 Transcript_39543/m.45021 type:complete len:400 (+) Transcript_39543:56-1255(+)